MPLQRDHAAQLYAAGADAEDLWVYMADGPYPEQSSFEVSIAKKAASEDPLFFAILEKPAGRAVGHLALMRIEPAHRVIEVGHVLYTPALQRTRGATEAIYLAARHIFEDLGYRRFEWKCNSMNEPSRRAAVRFGFEYEGTFRQHMIIKGRNRDTSWYAMLDSGWRERKAAFERWLAPENFDAGGRQRTALSAAK